MKIYDITVPISTELAVYPGDPPIELERVMSLDKGDIANVTRLAVAARTSARTLIRHRTSFPARCRSINCRWKP